MTPNARERLHTATWVILLLLLASGIFAFTVQWRKPWFNSSGNPTEAQLLTNALLFAKNWYREGPLQLRFGLFTAPASIELTTDDSRLPYRSFPPGCVVPIYLIAKLRGHEPTLSMLQKYNLMNHFLVALLLSWTVFALLRQLRYERPYAFIAAIIPILVELLTPGPLFQFQMRYFSDQPLALYFVLYVFLEVLRDSVSDRRARWILGCLQATTAFFGILTDYFLGLVALCVYAKRLIGGELTASQSSIVNRRSPIVAAAVFLLRSTLFWLPVAAGLLAFLVQIYDLGGIPDIVYKARVWGVALTGGLPWFSTQNYFWKVHLVHAYGRLGVALLWLSLISVAASLAVVVVRRVWRKPPDPTMAPLLALAFMLTVPCFLHAFILRAHSAFPLHYFSVLKFSIPLAVVPFVVAPLLVRSLLMSFPFVHRESSIPLLPVVMLGLACAFVAAEFPRVLPQFQREVENGQSRTLAEFVGANTDYEDLVFAWDRSIEIPLKSTNQIFSMKAVYLATSLQRAYDFAANVEGEYVVGLLVRENGASSGSNIENLVPLAYTQASANGLRLLKIRKQDFLKACKDAHVAEPGKFEPAMRVRHWEGEANMVRRLSEMTEDVGDLLAPDGQR